jgi:3-oxoacyl-[acyl-carrier-protein] synthase II
MQNRFFRESLPQRRVVITGIGAVSPLGLTAQESFENACKGLSGITKITRFDVSQFPAQIAGEVKNFNVDPFIHAKEVKKMDLFIQYSVAASMMALEDAGLKKEDLPSERTGVFIGVGIGGLPTIEEQHSIFLERGPTRISPFFIPKVITNLASGQISIMISAKGPNYSITSACASGSHAIGEAVNYIRAGLCDIMVAGGSESVLCPMAVGGFSAMKALSTRNDSPREASRPWDKGRDGFVLGEGAGTLILEDYEHASRRGARIYGEVTGYGTTSDANHMTSPAPEGEGGGRAMKIALENAKLNPEQIDYINAHGTSTPAGDPLESIAIENVFANHAKKLWISSTKSMTGHLLGAAGALESVFSVMALHTGIVPPTINLENPDDDCRLDYVPLRAREKKLNHVLNNSFGFGGTNACLIFSRLEK